jgi:hypothetical protein
MMNKNKEIRKRKKRTFFDKNESLLDIYYCPTHLFIIKYTYSKPYNL